jgi:alpha-D-ribose 1-methylphosphonate 5-triphosphate synthase subunit PhnI
VAYVAVSGGEEAIAASLELLSEGLSDPAANVASARIAAALPELIDQVMGESSLYEPSLAALALRQGGGSVEEAVFLLRAFRSTLERPYTSRIIETGNMRVKRRISAAFKDILGGQILGVTRDYSHRLLDFRLDGEEQASDSASPAAPAPVPAVPAPAPAPAVSAPAAEAPQGFPNLPKVAASLRAQGLLTPPPPDDTPPRDITMEPLSFPAGRDVRLQILARGMTQAVMALGYAALRGFGPAHPTVGELRYGTLDVLVDHPFEAGDEEDAYYVGALAVTEVESLFSVEREEQEAASADDTHELSFAIGYGLVYGRAESKAIAMSILDHCLTLGDETFPTQDEEFVLYHVDSIEATGFISHLKLPHYVTFQSKLNSVRRTRHDADVPGAAFAREERTDGSQEASHATAV